MVTWLGITSLPVTLLSGEVRASVYWLFAPVPGREQQLVMQQWDRLEGVNDSLTRRHLLAIHSA